MDRKVHDLHLNPIIHYCLKEHIFSLHTTKSAGEQNRAGELFPIILLLEVQGQAPAASPNRDQVFSSQILAAQPVLTLATQFPHLPGTS